MPGHDTIGVDRDQVVAEGLVELLEPPRGDQREDLTLVRDRLRKDDVERAHAVRRDHEECLVVHLVHVADLAAVKEVEIEGRF